MAFKMAFSNQSDPVFFSMLDLQCLRFQIKRKISFSHLVKAALLVLKVILLEQSLAGFLSSITS